MDIEKQIRKLSSVRGNAIAIQKKLKHLHRAAKAAGKIHLWRANEVQEIIEKIIKSADEEIKNLSRLKLEESFS